MSLLGTIKFVIDQHTDPAIVIVGEGGQCFRKEIDPTYKAHRPEMAPELRAFLAQTRLLFSAIGWDRVELASFEADDTLAAIATQLHGVAIHVTIATTDKDLWQLVGTKGVTIFNPYVDKHGSGRGPVSRADVVARWGVQPESLGDLLALMGDSSDGVPGVPGCGEKTAAKLLTEFKTLDGVVAASRRQVAAQKKPRVIDLAIVDAADSGAIARSRQLVELRRDVPLPVIDITRPAKRPVPGWSELVAIEMRQPGIAASLAAWFGPELDRPKETAQSPEAGHDTQTANLLGHFSGKLRGNSIAPLPSESDESVDRDAVQCDLPAGSARTLEAAFAAVGLAPREQWPTVVTRVESLGCEIVKGPNSVETYLARTPGGKCFTVYTWHLADESQRLTFSLNQQMSVDSLAQKIADTRRAAA